jgi:hypothetical protein
MLRRRVVKVILDIKVQMLTNIDRNDAHERASGRPQICPTIADQMKRCVLSRLIEKRGW